MANWEMVMTKRAIWTAAAAGLAMAVTPGHAAEIVVKMKNVDATGAMVFVPAYVQAAVGDTIHFEATDKGHNAMPIAGMIPSGVTAPPGVMNKDYFLTLSKPGLYGIKCSPHYSMGMVALIKAGKGAAPNAAAAAAVSMPGLAKQRMAPMLAAAK